MAKLRKSHGIVMAVLVAGVIAGCAVEWYGQAIDAR